MTDLAATDIYVWRDARSELVDKDVIIVRTQAGTTTRKLAIDLTSMVYGISVQRLLAPESWTKADIVVLIESRVRAIDYLTA